ncbi:WD40-repeat-containing domain protein [Coniochaeta sp. 2T2.1]|nr:WD40-repeat-containing domain protein [Coniochaeta sp. 2T2.1]
MLCAISGEAPEEPVVSKKSGAVFEKRLIEKYIEENGKDPVSGEELDLEDLLPIKTARIVRPRPPTLTSIPALLSQFQNEWDSLAIETYNLREQLARTREELATALYQHDAAVRVIARLTRERDEARDALSKVTVSGSAGANGDAMVVDNDGLQEDYSGLVDACQAKLSKSRKKRPAPEGWATAEDVSSAQQTYNSDSLVPESTSLATDDTWTAIGGRGGDVAVLSSEGDALKLAQSFNIGSPVTTTIVSEGSVIAGTAKGEVKVYTTQGAAKASFSEHAGPVTGVASHPSKQLLVSVGSDKSFVFYDIQNSRTLYRKFTDSSLTTVAFHPDGHLFAAGTPSGAINIYDTKTGEPMAVYELGASVSALVFSENGYWFAAASDKAPNVVIFDLRKDGAAARSKELPTTGPVRSLDWDYSAQFLAVAGPGGVAVHSYSKGSKAWSVLREVAEPAVRAVWGAKAKTLQILGESGKVIVDGAAQ